MEHDDQSLMQKIKTGEAVSDSNDIDDLLPNYCHITDNQQVVTRPKVLRKEAALSCFHSSTLTSITLNVGGNIFVTTNDILSREKVSLLADIEKKDFLRDCNNHIFIDRNGALFEHVLNYLKTGLLDLPKNFNEYNQLRIEAIYFRLSRLASIVDKHFKKLSSRNVRGAYVTLTSHGNYTIKRREQAETVFNRVASITVAGHVRTCKSVFGDFLSMDRDSNTEYDRYSCRMMLKDLNLVSSFNILQHHNYVLKTSETIGSQGHSNTHIPSNDQNRWIHTTIYVFKKINDIN